MTARKRSCSCQLHTGSDRACIRHALTPGSVVGSLFVLGALQRWSRGVYASQAGREYTLVYESCCRGEEKEPCRCTPFLRTVDPQTNRKRRICCLCAPRSQTRSSSALV